MKALKCTHCAWLNLEQPSDDGTSYLPDLCERCAELLDHRKDLVRADVSTERGLHRLFALLLENGLPLHSDPAPSPRSATAGQKIAMLIVSLLVGVAGVYPPWRYAARAELTGAAGYNWIFNPPPDTALDVTRLLTELAVIVVLGAALWLILGQRRRDLKLVAETKIIGFFDGWRTDQIITLANGERWQQVSRKYAKRCCDEPKARVYFDGMSYLLDVEGEVAEIRRLP
jgi:hypothetical protein